MRIEIPSNLAAKVLFASDRTCCVCRNPGRKTKIHHIDEDASNNAFENLAVLCDDCHSDAHTRHAFARNLTPELIQEYNGTWRAIVRGRISPTLGGNAAREYALEALLELSLACHEFKNIYLFESGPYHVQLAGDHTIDIWEAIIRSAPTEYTPEVWQRFQPLFHHGIPNFVDRTERLLLLHRDAVSLNVRTVAIRMGRELRGERKIYLNLMDILGSPGMPPSHVDRPFQVRFEAVFRSVGLFARAVDACKDEHAGA